ncbi:MAG: hypothetical protein Q9169_001513 [Polycauliona sp. 2 TL-2023]
MRFGLYAGVSSALAAGAIARACLERPNFYSSSVYIAQSNACLFILTNLALLSTYSIMLGLQKAFYGPLRPVEIEQLWEKAWFALTETALAMTIFRDEVGGWFLFMFTFLLISKVWNWLAEGRVEILEQQPPASPRLFHTRLSAALSLSVLFNVYMLRFCASSVLQQARPNMMVMFAFEFAVLTILSLSTTARYALSLYETAVIKRQVAQGREQLRHRPESPMSEEEANASEIDAAGWEEKGQWVFYLDIATDFFKLVLYLSFFCVLCMFYGMPIHIIRDVALTIRSFYKRIRDFIQYKQATRDMNARYPDATAEEIVREDVCIICRENMTVWHDPTVDGASGERQPIDERQRAKKLPCGHLLHFACLRSWLERQQICPTCRTPVLGPNVGQPNPNHRMRPNARGVPGANNPPPGGPHIYTLGPFRLVIGARINHHQLPHPAAAATAAAGDGSQMALQHRQPTTLGAATMSAQLNQIEQQITREMSQLNHLSDQLQVLRALQAELARLRGIQGIPNATGPAPPYESRPSLLQQSVQAYREVAVGHGQGGLPAGMTIPEGWTLHALHRIAGSAYRGPPARDTEEVSQRQQSAHGSLQAQDDPEDGVPFDLGSSSNPLPALETGSQQGTAQEPGPNSSEIEANVKPAESEQNVARPEAPSSVPPTWGFEDGRQSAAEGSGPDDRNKGKGKAVTVEDDADGAGG